LRHEVAAVFHVLDVETNFILLDAPFSDLLRTHRVSSQRPVAVINKAVVDLVGQLLPGESRPYLRPRQGLEILGYDKAGIEGDQSPDGGSEGRDEAARRWSFRFHFLQAFRHI
jgi:hypothetical protein